MYVDIAHIKQNGKVYKRVLLRENYRENGKVKHRTIANLSKCSDEEIQAIKLSLKHKKDLTQVGSFKELFETKQGLSVGAVFLLNELAKRLFITEALSDSIMGKLALWQVIARIIEQGSRLSSVRLAQCHAVSDILNLDSFSEDDLYKNLDWLCDNQEKIERQLFKSRFKEKQIPNLFLYDVTSSYLEGTENELGDWGYNRDGKKGKLQIVIGLLTDDEGVPVSIEVFKGNTNDTKTFYNQIKKIAERFSVKEVVIVGDRGMIKSAQISDLKAENFNYITAITKPQIETLLKQGTIQIELFNEKLCEVQRDGIRYILRKNPIRAEEIKNNREDKLEKIGKLIKEQNEYLSEHKKAKVPVALKKADKLIQKFKFSTFIKVQVEERILTLEIDNEEKEKVSSLDGCYVIKTELKEEDILKEKIHQRYKDLAMVEQGFRTMKTAFLETRPIFVRKEKRTRGHVFVVMLAYIIIHELQKLWVNEDITVQEGINELSMINNIEIKIKEKSYQQIPKPRKLGETLLNLANVTLPPSILSNNINVATKIKLPARRKRHIAK